MKTLTVSTLALGITGSATPVLAQTGAQVCGSPESARKFVEGMLDPKVRARLEQNPERVMAEYGIKVPKGLFSGKGKPGTSVKLPPEEDVRALLTAINQRQGNVQLQISSHYAFFAFFAFIL